MAGKRDYYKVKTGHATYYAEVWHQYPNIDKVYFGGNKRCLSFSVYLDYIDDPPNIDSLGYHEECNKRGDHVKGTGSVHLLNTGMQFIVEHYKLKHRLFQLKDTSHIECANGPLPLSIFYTTFHNKTWYEAKFKAQPLYITKDELRKQKNALRAYLDSPKPPLSDVVNLESINRKIRPILESVYAGKKVVTIRDFLNTLKDEYDCAVFNKWLPVLVTRFIPTLKDTEWNIQYTGYIPMNVSILEKKPVAQLGGYIAPLSFHLSELKKT